VLQAAFVEAVRRIVGDKPPIAVTNAVRATLHAYQAGDITVVAASQQQVCLADIADAVHRARNGKPIVELGRIFVRAVG
jgi:hypothetical protein